MIGFLTGVEKNPAFGGISKSQLLGVEVKCHMFVEAVLKVVGGEVNKLESTQKCCQIPALA